MTEQLQTESSYLGVRFGVDNNFFPPSRSGSSGWTFNKAGRIQLALVDVGYRQKVDSRVLCQGVESYELVAWSW